MYIVLDLEFYHNSKKEQLGSIKQLGAFKFNEQYEIIDIFELTVTKYTPVTMLKRLFSNFIEDVDTMYVWAKNNDVKALESVLGIAEYHLDIVDVQEYFKDVNLASLSSISEALSFNAEGRHNALIDAEYTFEIIKHFELNNKVSRKAIKNYINLIRSNEKLQKTPPEAPRFESKPEIIKNDYKLVTPGSMQKLNDTYYQITNVNSIEQIITDITNRKLPICKDGDFKLNQSLEQLVKSSGIIVFTNTTKFKDVAKKHEDKLIIVVDDSAKDAYLAIFVSKKVYKKFIK